MVGGEESSAARKEGGGMTLLMRNHPDAGPAWGCRPEESSDELCQQAISSAGRAETRAWGGAEVRRGLQQHKQWLRERGEADLMWEARWGRRERADEPCRHCHDLFCNAAAGGGTSTLAHHEARCEERLVIYCQPTSVSAAHATHIQYIE